VKLVRQQKLAVICLLLPFWLNKLHLLSYHPPIPLSTGIGTWVGFCLLLNVPSSTQLIVSITGYGYTLSKHQDTISSDLVLSTDLDRVLKWEKKCYSSRRSIRSIQRYAAELEKANLIEVKQGWGNVCTFTLMAYHQTYKIEEYETSAVQR